MSTEPDLIEARRTAGVVKMPNGQIVGPGDIAEVPKGEAEASDFWKPVERTKAKES